jgi:hypothetical protein
MALPVVPSRSGLELKVGAEYELISKQPDVEAPERGPCHDQRRQEAERLQPTSRSPMRCKTAKTLGLTIHESFLLRADEVIE